MESAALISLIGLGRQVIGWVVQQAALLAADEAISAEELQAIKTAAELSDTAWDEAIANIRSEL